MNYKKKFTISGLLFFLFIASMFILKKIDAESIGINVAIHNKFGVSLNLYYFTNALGILAILICVAFGFVGLVQWIKRKNILKVDLEIISLGLLYIITIGVYVIFRFVAISYRPIIMPGETMLEPSFPSSHTVLTFVVFGSAVMLIDKYIKKPKTAKNLKPILKDLIIIAVLGRLFCGAHWFTDITAGITISISLLFLYSGVLDLINANRAIVYFTRDLSAEGLKKIYNKVSKNLYGKVAIKLHTGEPEGPNIIPRPWVKELYDSLKFDAKIIETNTYYEGGRYTTEDHRKTLEVNGWNFCDVDIIDENGVVALPIKNGKWLNEIHVGKNITNYDSMLALTHFKGHAMGGFGGSNKNIGIGCADGRIGKAEIHTIKDSEDQWSISKEEFMERMTESTKGTIDYFNNKVSYINVMRNMSVSCDCEGCNAEPVITPDVGIFASLDILAIDSACVDVIYKLPDNSGKALIDRIESRHGLRQLSYMEELSMGSNQYTIIDIDTNKRITIDDITKDIPPVWNPDQYNTFLGRNKL